MGTKDFSYNNLINWIRGITRGSLMLISSQDPTQVNNTYNRWSAGIFLYTEKRFNQKQCAIQTFKTETVMVVSVKKIWKCFTTNYLNYAVSWRNEIISWAITTEISNTQERFWFDFGCLGQTFETPSFGHKSSRSSYVFLQYNLYFKSDL